MLKQLTRHKTGMIMATKDMMATGETIMGKTISGLIEDLDLLGFGCPDDASKRAVTAKVGKPDPVAPAIGHTGMANVGKPIERLVTAKVGKPTEEE